jgi:hypothetical protein
MSCISAAPAPDPSVWRDYASWRGSSLANKALGEFEY